MAQTAAEAAAALAAAHATWGEAQDEYEAALELAENATVERWKKLKSNAGKAPDALVEVLRAVAQSGELPECNAAYAVLAEEFQSEREALWQVLDEARSAHDVAFGTHKAQALLRSHAQRESELAALRQVYPDFQPLQDGEEPGEQIQKLAGLLEHSVIAQQLLEGQRNLADGQRDLADGQRDLAERVQQLEAAVASAKQAAARPAWASLMKKRADADLMIAAHDGDIDAADAALKAGANVNCTNRFEETPLHIVASLCEDRSEKVGGYLAVAKLLVAKGGDLSSCDNGGQTPLLLAASSGSVKMKHLLTAQLQIFAQLSPKKALAALACFQHFDIFVAVNTSYMGSSKHAELQAAACSAFAAYCSTPAGAAKAVAVFCIEAVVTAMTTHTQNAELQAAACAACAAFCSTPAGAAQAHAAGCLEAVVAAMTLHVQNAELQLATLKFLHTAIGTSINPSPMKGSCLLLFGFSWHTSEYRDAMRQMKTAPMRAVKLAFPEPHEVGVLATSITKLLGSNCFWEDGGSECEAYLDEEDDAELRLAAPARHDRRRGGR